MTKISATAQPTLDEAKQLVAAMTTLLEEAVGRAREITNHQPGA